MALRPAHLKGGPLDGHDGEVVTPSPDVLRVGPTGSFIYRLHGVKDGVVRYGYDAAASRRALLDAGIHPSLAAQADTDSYTQGLLLNSETAAQPAAGSLTVQAEVKRFSDRWELWASLEGADPVLVEQLPRSAFPDDDSDGLKEWVEASTHALAQEAMNA